MMHISVWSALQPPSMIKHNKQACALGRIQQGDLLEACGRGCCLREAGVIAARSDSQAREGGEGGERAPALLPHPRYALQAQRPQPAAGRQALQRRAAQLVRLHRSKYFNTQRNTLHSCFVRCRQRLFLCNARALICCSLVRLPLRTDMVLSVSANLGSGIPNHLQRRAGC